MKNILITGAAGFIGCNYIRYANQVHSDWDITIIDKLTYAGRLDNLNGCTYKRFIHGDISNIELVEYIINYYKIEAIINFAAESHVDRSIKDSRVFTNSNVVGVHTLCDLAVKYGVKRFLQIGTDEVYGTVPEPHLFTEEYPLFPKNPYSMGKAAGDLIVRAYNHTYGLNAVITRSSNNYGPYQFPEKLIPMVTTQALQNKPVYIYGSGDCIRDWIYVLDNCKAIDVVFHKGKSGQIYNIGGVYNFYSNLEIAEKVLEMMDKPKSLIEFIDARPGDDRRYATSIGKMMALGWQPEWTFEKGLETTIQWYLNNEKWWMEWKAEPGHNKYADWKPSYQQE